MHFYSAGNQPDQETGGYQETGCNKEHGIIEGLKMAKPTPKVFGHIYNFTWIKERQTKIRLCVY